MPPPQVVYILGNLEIPFIVIPATLDKTMDDSILGQPGQTLAQHWTNTLYFTLNDLCPTEAIWERHAMPSCSEKANSGNCLLEEQAVTAVCICTAPYLGSKLPKTLFNCIESWT